MPLVIVTAAADDGMVDAHDRRQVGFSSEHATLYMDIALPTFKSGVFDRPKACIPRI